MSRRKIVLTPRHYDILQTIKELQPCTCSQVAEALNLTVGQVYKRVTQPLYRAGLVDSELIKRRRKPGTFCLTKEGQNLLKGNKMVPDIYQKKALESWYKEDNPLYLDPRHPLIKLAGEAGELLDLYGKDVYKPNFSWWNCKHCGYGDASHSSNLRWCPDKDSSYTPLILDELGDWWYYARIITWQNKINITDWIREPNPTLIQVAKNNPLTHLAELNGYSAEALRLYLEIEFVDISKVHNAYNWFEVFLYSLDYPIDQLTELNYKKLNSEPTQHGWQRGQQ